MLCVCLAIDAAFAFSRPKVGQGRIFLFSHEARSMARSQKRSASCRRRNCTALADYTSFFLLHSVVYSRSTMRICVSDGNGSTTEPVGSMPSQIPPQ